MAGQREGHQPGATLPAAQHHRLGRPNHAGGGSAKEWTGTLEKVLALDFDTVVPGHGTVTNKQAVSEARASSQRMTEMLTQMVKQNRSRADIDKVLRNEFGFQDFHIMASLDGLINEMK